MENKENIKAENNNQEIQHDKPVLVVESKLPYYATLIGIIIGVIGFIYINYEIFFNKNYYYLITYSLVLSAFSMDWDSLKKYKDKNLPIVKFCKEYLEISCEVNFKTIFGEVNGGFLKEKVHYKNTTFLKTFGLGSCFVRQSSYSEIIKEIAPKNIYPNWFFKLTDKLRIFFYVFFAIPFEVSFQLIVSIFLLLRYGINYRIIYIPLKVQVDVRNKVNNKKINSPLMIEGFFVLVEDKSSLNTIEKLIKNAGGKIKWKPIITKL